MSSYDPLNPAVTCNPYPYYTQLREEEPVTWIASLQGFAVARWEDVSKCLTEPKTYSSSKFWPALLGEYDPVPEGPPMISMDPPGHVPIRKLSGKIFVPSRVNALQDQVARIANGLIDDIIARNGREGEFDYVAEFSALFPASVISEVLGVDVERRVEFKHWVDDLLSAANRAAFPPERLAQIERSSRDIRAYFEEIYDRRLEKPGDDLLSGFIHAEVNGQRLTRIEVLNLGILLLLGGVETTANLLAITCAQFRKYPQVLSAVRADPTKAGLLIEEVLRYDSPVQMLFRHTTEETILAGTRIPEGALVMPLLGSANRDPRKYRDADTLDLERNPKEIMSFGYGPHFCLGQYLSRMEARTAINLLLERFATLMPVSEEIQWMDTYFARGPKTLPVRFKVR
jgi:cytochrome P450